MAEKTTTGRLIAAAGGIALIVSLFLKWYSFKSGVNFGGVSSSASVGGSAWEVFGLIDIILFVVGVLAVLPAALDIFDLEAELPVDTSVVTLGAGAVGAILIVYRIIDKPGPDIEVNVPGVETSVGIGIGLIIGLIACAAIAFGGFSQMSEAEGGGVEVYGGAAAPPVPPAAPPQAPPQQQPPAPPAPPQAPPPQDQPPAAS